VRYPEIRVRLRTTNPLALVAAVRQALRRAGVERAEIRLFSAQAMAEADPNHVLRICREWVDAA
jgi:hypothetical protein